MKRDPKPPLRALLLVAGFELLTTEDEGKRARITDHAVRMAKEHLSAPESGFVNAVVRRLPSAFAEAPAREKNPDRGLALKFSHPFWLVERWIKAFGREATESLLQWNQQPAPVFLRLEDPAVQVPEELKKTQWEDYFLWEGGDWGSIQRLLQEGKLYAQDPSTRHPVELLSPQDGEQILDLCAAPGGKSRQIMRRMQQGLLVAVDKPGSRITHLRENLLGASSDFPVHVIERDLLDLEETDALAADLPLLYDAVLLDAPCSNTGVLRRRPDARWRLEEDSIRHVAEIQAKLIHQAAKHVRMGGRLVYSTCSIEAEENEQIVKAFLTSHPDFALEDQKISYPWLQEHDGSGAFLLRRNG